MQENKIGKKILILGNGFDLAHGLPTSYKDFLGFCECVECIFDIKISNISEVDFINYLSKNWKSNKENIQKNIEIIINKLYKEFKHRKEDKKENNETIYKVGNPVINEIHELISQNFWYLYFKSTSLGQNWIDFETEIKNIVEPIDKYSNSNYLSYNFYNIFTKIINDENYTKWKNIECKQEYDQNNNRTDFYYLSMKTKKGITIIEHFKTIQDFRDRLINDLKKLIRALELYLSEFVESEDIINNINQVEITNIETEKEKFTFNFQDVNIDYVITFNYTHIYEKIYNNFKTIFHIHGECIKDRLEESNTPVLGIDKSSEYGNNTIFNGMRKQSQRDKNSIDYEEFKKLEKIETYFSKTKMISEIHIFGHSLGIIDSYILKNILSSDATSIIVYCRKPKKYQISERDEKDDNITNIIGYDKKQEKREKQLIKYLTFTTREITPNNQEQKK